MADKNLQNAVAARDLTKIRDFLRIRLQLDHNVFGLFTESLGYCKANGISERDLYETHDGRDLPTANTKDNFGLLVGQLATNFSQKRLERVLEIAQAVWPNEQKQPAAMQSATVQSGATSTRTNNGTATEEYDEDGNRIISKRTVSSSAQASSQQSVPTEEYDEDGSRIISKRTVSSSSQSSTSGHSSYGERKNPKKEIGDISAGKAILAAVVVAAAIIAAVIAFA